MATLSKQEFARRAAEIEWLLLDVDGVMTDGSLYYGSHGPELLRFNVRDGLGIRLAQRAGLKIGVLSGRQSRALERRADELDLEPVISPSIDKAADFEAFLTRSGLRARQVAFVGDDLNDLVVLGRCGLSFAPADAAPEVRAVVQAVLETAGGHGAVRELIERLLDARGEWDRAKAPFSFEEQ